MLFRTSYIRFDSNGNEAEKSYVTNGKFIPYYAGTYKIVYEYADSIKSYVKVRDEVLSKILENCKVRARAEANKRLGCGESRPGHTVDTVRAPGPGRDLAGVWHIIRYR